jgi:DUF917 family protein
MSFEIRRSDLSALALGSGILGTGGGGNSYYGQLVASGVLGEGTSVRVIDVTEMDPEAFAISSAVIGAPLVCLEKPPSLRAMQIGFDSVSAVLTRRVGAFVAAEIGGLQCMFPLILAAQTGLPLLDGDSIGRAFPELQMCTFMIYGTTPGLPMALSHEGGMLLDAKAPREESAPRQSSNRPANEPAGIEVERRLRKICSDNGGLIYMTTTFDHESLTRTLIRGSIALALALGRAVEAARAAKRDPIAAIVEAGRGKRFIGGKVIDVERQFRAGHDWGTVRLEGVDADRVASRKSRSRTSISS